MGLYNFQQQFVQHVIDGSKTHTIRAERKYPSKAGDTLYLYTGLRTKAARPLLTVPCTKVEAIQIRHGIRGPVIFIELEALSKSELDELAWRDGFRDKGRNGAFDLMMKFWEGRLPFSGHIIHWDYALREVRE